MLFPRSMVGFGSCMPSRIGSGCDRNGALKASQQLEESSFGFGGFEEAVITESSFSGLGLSRATESGATDSLGFDGQCDSERFDHDTPSEKKPMLGEKGYSGSRFSASYTGSRVCSIDDLIEMGDVEMQKAMMQSMGMSEVREPTFGKSTLKNTTVCDSGAMDCDGSQTDRLSGKGSSVGESEYCRSELYSGGSPMGSSSGHSGSRHSGSEIGLIRSPKHEWSSKKQAASPKPEGSPRKHPRRRHRRQIGMRGTSVDDDPDWSPQPGLTTVRRRFLDLEDWEDYSDEQVGKWVPLVGFGHDESASNHDGDGSHPSEIGPSNDSNSIYRDSDQSDLAFFDSTSDDDTLLGVKEVHVPPGRKTRRQYPDKIKLKNRYTLNHHGYALDGDFIDFRKEKIDQYGNTRRHHVAVRRPYGVPHTGDQSAPIKPRMRPDMKRNSIGGWTSDDDLMEELLDYGNVWGPKKQPLEEQLGHGHKANPIILRTLAPESGSGYPPLPFDKSSSNRSSDTFSDLLISSDDGSPFGSPLLSNSSDDGCESNDSEVIIRNGFRALAELSAKRKEGSKDEISQQRVETSASRGAGFIEKDRLGAADRNNSTTESIAPEESCATFVERKFQKTFGSAFQKTRQRIFRCSSGII